MKTKIHLFAAIVILAANVTSSKKANGQAYLYGPVGSPSLHDELQSRSARMAILAGNGMGAGADTLKALGINNNNPQYMLDVLCGPGVSAKSDINVSSSSGVQNVGYRIGGNMVLWTAGATANIYVGVGAGNAGTNNTATGYDALHFNTSDANTADGYMALYNNTAGGGSNTAVGAHSLYSNTTGSSNTAVGWGSLTSNTVGVENTATGTSAMYSVTAAQANTAMGYEALYSDTSGSYNTAFGVGSLAYTAGGGSNTAAGSYALNKNTSGSYNTATGMWSLSSNTSGLYNTATGYQSLYMNITGSNNTAEGYQSLHSDTGSNNTSLGAYSLYSNNRGSLNVAIGVAALYYNQGPSGNVAVGDSAIYSQSVVDPFNSGNVAIGNSALFTNQATGQTTGTYNTATGQWALRHNINGYYNTATGGEALYSNISGFGNAAVGYQSGYNNNGNYNTFLGNNAGMYNANGMYNTFIGYQAGSSTGFTNISNTTCLGHTSGVLASNITSNSIYLGNNSIQFIYMEPSSISSYSDRRIKENIHKNVPGLAFITKLQPVTYNLNIHKQNQLLGVQNDSNWNGKYEIEKTIQTGFIAQQVDSAAQAIGYNFSGVTRPQSSGGLYALGYADFVVPLVKAVQELNAKNDSLHATVDSLRDVLKSIQTCLSQLCGANGNGHTTAHQGEQNGNLGNDSSPSGTTNVQDVTLSEQQGEPVLYQNIPNPFSIGTKINYYLPEGTVGAIIIFYNTYGNMLKTIPLTQTGNGTLNITSDNLSNGIYSYSLIVNGSILDTKRMVLQK